MERGLGPGSEKHLGVCGCAHAGRVRCGADGLQDSGKSDTLSREGGRGLSSEARSDSIRDKWNCRPMLPKDALCPFAPPRVSTAANVRCHSGPHTGARHAAAIQPASDGQFLKWIFLQTT